MSIKKFEKAYADSDIEKLHKFITKPKVLGSTRKFMMLADTAFLINSRMFDIMDLILFNKYDFNRAIKIMIKNDNVDMLENILSRDVDKLDENLIGLTVNRGRVTITKAEFIHGTNDSYEIVKKLLRDYQFIPNLVFGWYDGRNDPTYQSVQYMAAVIPG